MFRTAERFSSDDSSIKAVFVQLVLMCVADLPDLILASTVSLNCGSENYMVSWKNEETFL